MEYALSVAVTFAGAESDVWLETLKLWKARWPTSDNAISKSTQAIATASCRRANPAISAGRIQPSSLELWTLDFGPWTPVGLAPRMNPFTFLRHFRELR